MNTARNLSWYPSTGLSICMPILDNDSKHNPRHFNIRSAHIPSLIFGWIPSWFRKKKICETNMNQNWECRDVCRSVSTSTIPSQSHQSHPPNNGKLRKEWPQVMIILPYCPSCWHLIVDHDDHWWSLMKTIIAMYFCCIDHRMKVRIHLKVRRAPRDKTGSSLIEKWEE